jgi:chemotaxis protein MotB
MAVEEDPPPAVPEWVVSFGDMMSLLLTFFIMLVSMSEIKKDDDKFQAMIDSLRAKFGDDFEKLRLAVGTGIPSSTKPAKTTTKRYNKWDNSQNFGAKAAASPGDKPTVRNIRPGAQIVVGGPLFFEEVSDELTDTDREQLERIAEELKGKPQKIEIRGHTSRRPLPEGSAFRDHWDLAYARCRKTMKALIELGIDARRIRMGVAAGNEPLHFGGDPLLLKENSRVEVMMLGEVPNALLATEAQAEKSKTE